MLILFENLFLNILHVSSQVGTNKQSFLDSFFKIFLKFFIIFFRFLTVIILVKERKTILGRLVCIDTTRNIRGKTG